MHTWLAYEDNNIVGVFTDTQMAKQWVALGTIRCVFETPLLDKTFGQMAVEYNTKYEH